jgi:hypothetical protein
VSEADDTGRKLKTFVPANGVTLAQQQVIYYQGTTERLTFVHQDASTTGTQETSDDGTLVNPSTRSGEYDPLGRNIASAGPYISLDTNPPGSDSGSGINMLGSGEGYRPGRQSFRIDGQAVPAGRFMEEMNTGIYGGAFGLIELGARMSIRFAGYSLKFGNGDIQYAGTDLGGALGQMEGGETLIRNWHVSDSWAVTRLISPPDTFADKAVRRLTQDEADTLKGNMKSRVTGKCKQFIERLINKVAGDLKGEPVTDIWAIFDAAFTNRARQGNKYPGGLWGYLDHNGGATGGVNWNDGYVALALNFSDTAYDITPRPNGDGSFQTRLSQSEFNALPAGVRAARLATAQANYLRSSAGALIAIHELIHNAVKPFGAGDGDLATAALSFTDQELVPSTSSENASVVWDDRLAEACGGQRRRGIEKFIRKRGGVQ